jgi:hypothetical protein
VYPPAGRFDSKGPQAGIWGVAIHFGTAKFLRWLGVSSEVAIGRCDQVR